MASSLASMLSLQYAPIDTAGLVPELGKVGQAGVAGQVNRALTTVSAASPAGGQPGQRRTAPLTGQPEPGAGADLLISFFDAGADHPAVVGYRW